MIDPINSNYSVVNDNVVKEKNNENNIAFSKMLKDSINKVNDLQIESDSITKQFSLGKVDNIHDVTIAAEKAKTALNLTIAVQNKVLDAYNELMRMQV